MKRQFIKVCMLSGMVMPLFSASLMAAGNPNPIVAQQQQVQGTVVDKTGEPLIGVTVQVVGQQGGAVTDLDGHYSIKAARVLKSSSLISVSRNKSLRSRGLSST